ncbi:MAG: hypothetical protein ACM31C_19760 [Acidobacteriota bacterium]
MKRETKPKKLTFSSEKLRQLANDQLRDVVGGTDLRHCAPQPCGMTYSQ